MSAGAGLGHEAAQAAAQAGPVADSGWASEAVSWLHHWLAADWGASTAVPNVTDTTTLVAILGMTVVSVVTRSFFFLSSKPWRLPTWAQRGLQYAPIAALAAVIVPEVVMTQGALVSTLKDARIYAALAGAAFFFWRKGQGQAVLGTIVAGMTVYLPLHLGLGW